MTAPRARAAAEVFQTTVTGVGPWCVEFPDGEIVTTRTEERARQIADMADAVAQATQQERDEGQVRLANAVDQALKEKDNSVDTFVQAAVAAEIAKCPNHS